MRSLLIALIVAAAALSSAAGAPAQGQRGSDLVAHEWGTFTSVAAPDGSPVDWVQSASDDLPCFVEKRAWCVKCGLATIRMETPVIYFYAPSRMTVDVSVRFKRGAISEWYPRAVVTPAAYSATTNMGAPGFESRIVWNRVHVVPDARTPLPNGDQSSHYYVARATDAAPVQVDGQTEKFLFYRGVGAFAPPIRAAAGADGQIALSGTAPLGDVILFENRGGETGFVVRRIGGKAGTLPRPVLEGSAALPLEELTRVLVANGLYLKEAEAMVNTWRDSWFEEGSRVFYVAPRTMVDATLPLTITPAPRAVARVFVGRIELLTETTKAEVRKALNAGDKTALARHGRFALAFANQIAADAEPAEAARIRSTISRLGLYSVPASRCAN